MDDLVECMVQAGNGQAGGTQKAYAMYSMLFVSKGGEAVEKNAKAEQLAIEDAQQNQKTLFQQMQPSQ